MSILAAAVCEKSGDLLLSRQFSGAGISQLPQMEESYPVLLKQGAQRSAVEQDGLRYIFEPLDELVVALVSDAEESNILQDLKTLRLLAELVRSVAASSTGSVSAKDIASCYPDIVDAFDEVVSSGYAENLTANQVETFLKMESHEEKIQQIIERNKQLEAAEERKKKAREFDLQRSEGVSAANFQGFGGNNSKFGSSSSNQPFNTSQPFSSQFGSSSVGAGSDYTGLGGNSGSVASKFDALTPSTANSDLKNKGLKLGKKAQISMGASGMPLLADPQPLPTKTLAKTSPAPVAASTTTDISIVEQLTIELTREGAVKTSRVSGTLNLFAGDREHTKLQIHTSTSGNAAGYKPHPKMDRAQFANNRILALKNPTEELPAAPVLLAKWTADIDISIPVNISCWVSKSADPSFFDVALEYEVSADYAGTLENLAISVPLTTSNAHVSDPASNYEQYDDRIVWVISEASASTHNLGSFEFTAEADTEDDFYPLSVSFQTKPITECGEEATFGKIAVTDIVDSTTGASVEFNKSVSAKTASFVIR